MGHKRSRASVEEEERLAVITWNVDGLRALLRTLDGVHALRQLLRMRRPVLLCLIEHKLQDSAHHKESASAREQLESLAEEEGYVATWTFSPRPGLDGLVTLSRHDAVIVTPPMEPVLSSDACTKERRLIYVELEQMHVVFAYAPNSGREGRLRHRLEEWEPSVREHLRALAASGKPVLYQGDLNVAHARELDCWGTTDAQFGGYKASGRTREEMAAMDTLLSECGLVDGFRHFHPEERSPTCWAQKKGGEPEQREHWKRYDYALVSKSLVKGGQRGNSSGFRLLDVRHCGDAFEGGRPDHLPVESCFGV